VPEQLSLAQARRIAVAAQMPRQSGRYRTVLDRLGCIQLDTISAVRRAHEVALLARGVDVAEAAESLRRRRVPVSFEYWGHAMSLLPTAMWPYMGIRREQWRQRVAGFDIPERAFDDVRALLADRGAVTVSDFPSGAMHRGDGVANMGDSWDRRTDHKQAVDWMLFTGEVVCTHRVNGFKRVYQLAERAIPEQYFWDADEETSLRHLTSTALRNLGVATSKDIADYFRLPVAAVTKTLRESGVEQVRVEGWRSAAWIDPDVRLPRRPVLDEPVAVSMFDSLVWLRERMERLWGHGWKIEIYVPAAQRTFGYYCMPVFVGDDLPGRVALRRNNGELVVEAAEWDAARADVEHLVAAVDRAASWLEAKPRWDVPVPGR
jgi:uncharacterized protein